jgi:hypothetical protein
VRQPGRTRRPEFHLAPVERRAPASSSFTVAGLRPASRTAVSPTPQPSSTRPGASSSIVAIEEAVTVGWRLIGFASSVPSVMRVVARAAAASST